MSPISPSHGTAFFGPITDRRRTAYSNIIWELAGRRRIPFTGITGTEFRQRRSISLVLTMCVTRRRRRRSTPTACRRQLSSLWKTHFPIVSISVEYLRMRLHLHNKILSRNWRARRWGRMRNVNWGSYKNRSANSGFLNNCHPTNNVQLLASSL